MASISSPKLWSSCVPHRWGKNQPIQQELLGTLWFWWKETVPLPDARCYSLWRESIARAAEQQETSWNIHTHSQKYLIYSSMREKWWPHVLTELSVPWMRSRWYFHSNYREAVNADWIQICTLHSLQVWYSQPKNRFQLNLSMLIPISELKNSHDDTLSQHTWTYVTRLLIETAEIAQYLYLSLHNCFQT